VEENRRLYRRKYAMADEVLSDLPGYTAPEAGFFLWLEVADGEAAALRLWREAGVRVLPGAYLAQDAGEGNPGAPFIRAALVAPDAEVLRGLQAIRRVLET
jgi:DNA-binding transcriptional MocR family regulator